MFELGLLDELFLGIELFELGLLDELSLGIELFELGLREVEDLSGVPTDLLLSEGPDCVDRLRTDCDSGEAKAASSALSEIGVPLGAEYLLDWD
ncbi:hypothetical protein EV11_0740 [Prochlorococcus sp. SS52]|uniref:hypothetical protein n=1 Tax=Prochlorococcus marinus TaxID=1219 RepID=UPI000533901B|nr:hypothetical protein [Prochlorococcus marinus]KGG11608.1 hypothetical protein EV04_1135 [Prochlorococcus marinus str. LG]KGG11617.1 hypothetical protein EV04_0904 [Prochlorococcus marinus str. LG]KGG35464.1 hypothetical protein EV11_1414 [Prochlorococcus sp. SS52]KGG36563.1 hypothetical protein EV11_0740 [Prochlorococcus sp. SS52]